MNLISQHNHFIKCIRKEAFLKRKHKLVSMRLINITEFQNFQLLKYRFSMRTECASRYDS